MTESRLEKITKIVSDAGVPRYTLDQITTAIYKDGVTDYMEMKNVPLSLRQKLKEELGDVLSLKVVQEIKSDQVHKVLFETKDGERIETVRMLFHPEDGVHESLCISSQSGCNLGCKFCATGAIGFKKNLSAEEISDQILFFRSSEYKTGSISFMGMGEPFANPNLFDALKLITDPKLMGISPRRLSVSTVGLIPGIRRLTKEFPQVNLAFSLHSPFHDQRSELMPITKVYPVSLVFQALDDHVKITNKKVFIAYVLLKGVNDSDEHAKELIKLIKARGKLGYLYHVNLIRYHPGPTIVEYQAPEKSKVVKFMNTLLREKVNCTLRQSFGVNIDAACGQLYAKYQKKIS